MKAERAKWEAEVEELRREANKKPSAKHTAQQQINFNEAMRKTSEAKDRKIDELQKEIEALRKQQQHNGGNLSRYVIWKSWLCVGIKLGVYNLQYSAKG